MANVPTKKLAEGTINRMEKAIAKGNDTPTFLILIIMALTNDFLDYLIIGSIPIVGDFIDVFTWLVLTIFLFDVGGFIKLKVRLITWIASGLELIPGIDVIPTFTIAVLWAWYKVRKQAKFGEQGIKQISKHSAIEAEIAKRF